MKNAMIRAFLLPVLFLSLLVHCRSGDCPGGEPSCLKTRIQEILDTMAPGEKYKALGALSGDVSSELCLIVLDSEQPVVRRYFAIEILAHYDNADSRNAFLQTIRTEKTPFLRGCAMRAYAFIMQKRSVPVLIEMLEDRSVFLLEASTGDDEVPVYISDEAVKLLEKITGITFKDNKENLPHRSVDGWRKWWARQIRDGKDKIYRSIVP